MKKPMIVLVLALIFLVGSIAFVIYGNKDKYEDSTIKNMDIEYVNTNFEMDMYDEKSKENITLELSAKYIGSDEIKEEPKISTTVNCYYTYIDADESYSDMIYQDVLLEKDGKNNKYKGKTVIDIGRTDIESYSCSYRVLDTSGKYIEFSK